MKGSYRSGGCGCGSTLPILESVDGREKEFLPTQDGERLSPKRLLEIAYGTDSFVPMFQIIHEGDSVSLQVHGEGGPEDSVSDLSQKFTRLFGRIDAVKHKENAKANMRFFLNKRARGQLDLTSRDILFLVFLFFAFINPLSIFFMNTPFVFLFSVTLNVIVWIGLRQRESRYRGNLFEIILGSSLLVVNYGRNLLGILGGGQIGIFDMFLMFLGSYLIFYGVRGLRSRVGPLVYFGLMYAAYQAEFAFPVLVHLEYFMLDQIAHTLGLLGMKAEVFGDFVRLTTQVETYFLQIGGPFAGIKGFLAYAPLSLLLVKDMKTTRWTKTLRVIRNGDNFSNFLSTHLADFLYHSDCWD